MAMTEKAEHPVATMLIGRWEAAAKKFMELAEVLPDDKFEVELVKGARTCGGVLRHVAYWNRYVADSLQGNKAHGSANELARNAYPDKAAILSELRKSNGEISRGINRALNTTSMEPIAVAFEHLSEHYGQIAVYSRLMGITPPASRSYEAEENSSEGSFVTRARL